MATVENEGYVNRAGRNWALFSGWSTKTFATLGAAVKFALRNGIKLRTKLPKPILADAEQDLREDLRREREEATRREARDVPDWLWGRDEEEQAW